MVHGTSGGTWRLTVGRGRHDTVWRLGKVWGRTLEHLWLGHVVLGQPSPQLWRWEVGNGLGQFAKWFEGNRVHAVFVGVLTWRVGCVGVCWCRDCWRRSWRASLSRWRRSVLLRLDVQSTARRRSLVVALDERNTLRRKQGNEVTEEKVGHTNWQRQRRNRQFAQGGSLELFGTFVETSCIVSVAYSAEAHGSTGASVCSVAKLVVAAFVDATETFPGGGCAWQVFIELESKSL